MVCDATSALGDGLVSGTVGGAIREEPVDDHATDREQEDNQAPQDFVGNWTVGLQHFDYSQVSFA